MADDDPILTPAGRERRDRIEAIAVRAALARRTRRRAVRAAAALMTAVAAALAIRIARPGPHDQPRPLPPLARLPRDEPAARPAPVATSEPTSVPAPVAITFVPTDPSIVDRLRAEPAGPPRWQAIGDRELLDALVAAGRPTGMVRAGGRVYLVTP
jgi:hypothetical protein